MTMIKAELCRETQLPELLTPLPFPYANYHSACCVDGVHERCQQLLQRALMVVPLQLALAVWRAYKLRRSGRALRLDYLALRSARCPKGPLTLRSRLLNCLLDIEGKARPSDESPPEDTG